MSIEKVKEFTDKLDKMAVFTKILSAPDYEIKVVLQRTIFDMEKKYHIPKEEVAIIMADNYDKLQKELNPTL